MISSLSFQGSFCKNKQIYVYFLTPPTFFVTQKVTYDRYSFIHFVFCLTEIIPYQCVEILFHMCKRLHCTNIPQLIQPLMSRGSGCCQYFKLTNSATTNNHVHVIFILLGFYIWGKFLKVELLDKKVVLNRCAMICYWCGPLQRCCTNFHSSGVFSYKAISHGFFSRMCSHAC